MNENLLSEIQNEAVDADGDLTTLLRKCRILAQRLGNQTLKNWVISELDGYSDDDEPPAYRIITHLPIMGDYLGPGGSRLNNVQIPASAIEERYRKDVITMKLRDAISSLLSSTEFADGGFLTIGMNPDVMRVIHYKRVSPHLILAHVSRHLPVSVIDGIADSVRNRILNFTLELEDLASLTGEPFTKLKEEHPREIQQIVTNNIYGSSIGNLSQGGSQITQNASIQMRDFDVVNRCLKDIGVPKQEIEEIEAIVTTEPQNEDGSWGSKVSDKIAKLGQMAASGILTVSSSVATELFSEALKKYYNLT